MNSAAEPQAGDAENHHPAKVGGRFIAAHNAQGNEKGVGQTAVARLCGLGAIP